MPYHSIAEVYDRINGEAYAPYADYLEREIRERSRIPVEDVLDLGCGTGRITALMADKGFGLVGVDYSAEMLDHARKYNEGKNTLLLLQDMREFELYGTVQAVYSSFDCLNYLRTAADLETVFALVHNYLEPGGVFLFDLNTKYRFREVYGDNTFSYEFEDELLVWRNEPTRTGTRFVLDRFFGFSEDGKCRYEHEEQSETYHSEKRILRVAKETGFSLLAVSGGFDGEPLTEASEKAYYVFLRD